MSSHSRGPVESYSTTDADEGLAFLDDLYPEFTHTGRRPAAPFALRVATGDLGGLVSTQMSYRATWDGVVADDGASVLVIQQRSGRYDLTATGHRPVALRAHGTVLVPTGGARARTDGLDAHTVQVPVAALRVAAGDVDAVVQFERLVPSSAAVEQQWALCATYVHQVLESDVGSSPLVSKAATEMAAAVVLACFAHSLDRAPADQRRATPATVRRAVAFVEGHAAEPIGLADIAEAARLSPRGLQTALRRHLDTTPSELLRRVRLDGARRDLVRGDPADGSQVAAVALRWGFASPRHFATAYRRAYGETPSTTLRR